MSIQRRALRESDYSQVEELFTISFPKIPPGDLLVSWTGRSRKSIGMFIYDMLVGFVIASQTSTSVYIDYFALHPDFRGGGLGSSFLLELVKECYETNGSVHLYPERDDLVPWYERNGFRKTHGGYYVFHSHKTRAQHAVHLRLGLSDSAC